MGNSASQLPYSIDNQVGAPHDHNGWALHNGKSTDGNGRHVSVFVGKKPQLAKQPVSARTPHMMQLVPALHHYNYSRKLRHPHILKVLATLDTDNPTAASNELASGGGGAGGKPEVEANSKQTTGDLIIVTEPCISLNEWLLKPPTPEQLAWGLESIIRGLQFLHTSANLAHGNLSPSSFYVTQSGDVKLWNFSIVTPVGTDGVGPTKHFQEWEQACTPDAYRSPERIERRYDTIGTMGGVHSMDSFALGVLIDHWFSGHIPGPLQKAVQRLQTPNIKMRPRLQPLLKCPIFDTPYQKLQLQLEEIQIQPVEQKVALWHNLFPQLQNGTIPQDVALYKLLPLIQSSIKSICTNDAMLNQDLYRREVLAMVPLLFYIVESYVDPSDISKELGPLVILLFAVKDRGVRGALLNKVSFMTQHLDKNTLNSNVFEPLCSGFNDSSPALRELTLKATLGLVPFLNPPNIEKLSRYLVRLQNDSETSIRTNAVIFIAKLAPSLSEISREKMLLPAYARAMKDTFAPCRLSALQSALKSRELFSKADLAAKVLPAVMPLLLDPMVNVRKEAFQVVDSYLQTLREESDRIETLAKQQALQQQQQQQQQQQTSVPATTAAEKATPAIAAAPASGSYLTGLSSWMSSSTKPQTPSPASKAQPPATSQPTITTNPVPAPARLQPVQQQFAATSLGAASSPPPAAAVDDGWGDEVADDGEDGWGDDDLDNSNNNDLAMSHIGRSTATTASTPMMTTSAPVVATQTFSSTSAAKTASMMNDFDDDPFAAIGMKTATSISARPVGAAAARGKLVIPKKTGATALKVKPATPATKLKMDDSELGDGWDDF